MHSRSHIEKRFRMARTVLISVWAVFTLAIVFYTVHVAGRNAEGDILAEAGETLSVQSETLSGVLDKYRLMAPLLARQSSVASLFILNADGAPQAVAARGMAGALTGMSAAEDVAFFFPDGTLLGHANGPFVETRAGLDGLIRDASQGRLGRAMLALGPEQRSYAFSSGVRRNGKLVGIVVVYVDFFRVEAAWALSNRPIYVTEADGTIILANIPNWRMREAEDVLMERGDRVAVPDDGSVRTYLDMSRYMPVLGWTLHVLADPSPAASAKVSAGAIATLACLLAGLVALIVLRRNETALLQARSDRATALRLERVVRDRTEALSESNRSLSREVETRREAEMRLRAAQAELIQAAKLAALGQMSAAISHEFNQPLAAIRSYADNGQKFIDRGRADSARENLGRINGLVDRMAELSRALLSFARKPGQTLGSVHLGTVIEEALLLARPRARKAGVEVRLLGDIDTMMVSGGRVRLGQVFVNLVNNAVDAIGERDGGLVEIRARRDEGVVIVEVSDNGPGIPEATLQHIFDPFFTTKATGEGIGIGLSIVDNIVRDFGGKVSARNGETGGAVFRVELLEAEIGAKADA
ncbi:sensor histidine kinase [Pseudohoeflea suaedae]|uniref:C4-dicarboxylate transport sensor protein n=2 Tax=Pseudohoeflea suaedae TaxID=877384 RepID=A0A4R5PJF4_9HYPH|nr:sensor histidine kinase [Pseudohoeflea suaedae]